MLNQAVSRLFLPNILRDFQCPSVFSRIRLIADQNMKTKENSILLVTVAFLSVLMAGPVICGSLEELLLSARGIEASIRGDAGAPDAISAYQKVYVRARIDHNDEAAAGALFSVSQILSDRIGDRARAQKYLRKIADSYPGTSWCDRALEMLRDDSGRPGSGSDATSGPTAEHSGLGVKVSCPAPGWLMTSSVENGEFRVFAAPEREMALGGPYPNISLTAMRGKTTMDIIAYVNSVQNQAMKKNLEGYRLSSQDVVYLKGGIVAVEKTFRFNSSGRKFKARQLYSSRGTTMVVATFTAPEELFDATSAGFDDFIGGMVLN